MSACAAFTLVSELVVELIRSIMHWELTSVVLLIPCAALMERGVGQVE